MKSFFGLNTVVGGKPNIVGKPEFITSEISISAVELNSKEIALSVTVGADTQTKIIDVNSKLLEFDFGTKFSPPPFLSERLAVLLWVGRVPIPPIDANSTIEPKVTLYKKNADTDSDMEPHGSLDRSMLSRIQSCQSFTFESKKLTNQLKELLAAPQQIQSGASGSALNISYALDIKVDGEPISILFDFKSGTVAIFREHSEHSKPLFIPKQATKIQEFVTALFAFGSDAKSK